MFRFRFCTEMIRTKVPKTALNRFISSFNQSRSLQTLSFATVEAEAVSGSQPAEVQNLVQGTWKGSSNLNTVVDPLNGEPFIKVAEVDETGVQPFVESLSKCSKSGLHNPFRSPERYLLYGDISTKAAHMLSQPEVSNFFTRLIQRVSPKSYQQAFAEVFVTQKFFENFCGDQVRFLARSFSVPGNHLGQQSHGFRWPYGPVVIVTPFNFPLEIPVLQLMGALYMGNKPLLKVDSKVSIVMDQMLRLLHQCGLPKDDVDFINSDGKTMNKLLLEAKPRMTLFTGSSRVAEKLAVDLKGRVKLEDAGFDWKILGPDVQEVDYIAWVCDQDAYACSGQKCSAQSIVFVHEVSILYFCIRSLFVVVEYLHFYLISANAFDKYRPLSPFVSGFVHYHGQELLHFIMRNYVFVMKNAKNYPFKGREARNIPLDCKTKDNTLLFPKTWSPQKLCS
ncbi:hypothetical protein AQUCO_00200515v1 [Aquilegia coerulea]|uniref:Aldehyde dehydrogenase domain-containing protein n=1 Tax=Aquilegia coerulea TaxID=218851 RepID=A0A2G5F3G5_AQUCA|nr:hypothetical protein AQUCO_00200515v1 [Aquilegia coerulea]